MANWKWQYCHETSPEGDERWMLATRCYSLFENSHLSRDINKVRLSVSSRSKASMHRLVDNDMESILHVKLCNIIRSSFRSMYQSWSFNLKSINRKERRTCGQKKIKIPNSRGYFRPGRIWIRRRLKPMQLFSNSKTVIFVKAGVSVQLFI